MTRIKRINDEVFVAEDQIVQVDRSQLETLKAQAARNPRRRARICAHKDVQDKLHEMLIVMARGTYVRPHKHLHKPESFHVIEGTATVIFFDEAGKGAEIIRIGEPKSGRTFYFRNDDPRYHTQIVTSDFLVFHETTKGPFDRADTVFAPWSPEENDVVAVKAFMEKLSRDANQS